MSIEFKLPELGENIESAQVTGVLVSEGDKVEVDQNVIEIETDKASVEVPSDVSGIVKKIHVNEGDTAEVGSVILSLEESDESTAAESKTEQQSEQKAETKEAESQPVSQPEQKAEESKKEKGVKTAGGGMVEFKLPDLGENIESADVTKVNVSEGDTIEQDQTVMEIETDKASVEVPSDVAGVIKKVNVKEGDSVSTGQVILEVESSSGAAPAAKREETPAKEEKSETKKEPAKEEAKVSESEVKEVSQTPPVLGKTKIPQRKDMPKHIPPAAPSVRRFAREIGGDIHQVRGTGPGGRISIDDVKAYSKNLNEQRAKGGGAGGIGFAQEPLPDFSKWGEVEHKPMSNVRKKTAEHLSYAWATIPHVTQHDKADITELDKLRKKYSPLVEKQGAKLTVTAILLKVVGTALQKYPQFNCSIDMENKEIIYKKFYNVGVAVDTDRGLLVPVIRDVDKKSITGLSVELNDAAKRARDKKTSLDEMQGGNFSISNLGGIGGTYFTPVVNSPEVAILGVSRGSFEPVYQDGEFVPRLMLPLSLSYDHRIIDGADAARFLRWIVEALEQPLFLNL